MTFHSTQIRTHNPARADVASVANLDERQPKTPSRRWALAGVGAGLFGAGTIVSSGMIDALYDPALAGNTAAISDKLAEKVPQILAFQVFGMLSAVLMVVFAAGLYRRLHASAPDSIAPLVAFSGMLATAMVLVLGTGLNTEFIFGAGNEEFVAPDNAAMFNHWVGTIPWCWALVGLTGIAVHIVARAGAAPRWIGYVGLIGGGLTLLLGISPLQYMAGMTGPIVLTIVAVGFLVGDRVRRA